jgi:hypothetical protein
MGGAESDVPGDPHVAQARRSGGRQPEGEADQHSTTGTTDSDEFVGRVAGQDADDVGETGAEARAEAERAELQRGEPADRQCEDRRPG